MQWLEYRCPKCEHEFKRLVMRGEKSPAQPCPRCGTPELVPLLSGESLFDGISNFSALGKDVN